MNVNFSLMHKNESAGEQKIKINEGAPFRRVQSVAKGGHERGRSREQGAPQHVEAYGRTL